MQEIVQKWQFESLKLKAQGVKPYFHDPDYAGQNCVLMSNA
jgi:hypothetical protein